MTGKKEEKVKRGDPFDDFCKDFERGMKKAGIAHKKDMAKPPKYDLDVIKSGQGGFIQPDDDGIIP
jgi:hypothetical protein